MIDLTKILRNAPLDLKLYSPMFGEVCFKEITEDGIVFEYKRQKFYADEEGRILLPNCEYTKDCLLFPDRKLTWNNWQNSIFKSGDIIKHQNGQVCLLTNGYLSKSYRLFYFEDNGETPTTYITDVLENYSYATYSERKQLYETFTKKGYKIMSDKDGTVINVIPIEFKPGDIVNVEDDEVMIVRCVEIHTDNKEFIHCQDENAKEYIVESNNVSKVTNQKTIEDFNNSLAENGYYWSRVYKGLQMAGDLSFNLGDYVRHVRTGEQYLIASYEDEENGTGYYGILEGNMITSRQIQYGRESEFVVFDAKPELLFREDVKCNEGNTTEKETNSETKEIEKRIIKGFIENLMKEYKITPDMLNVEERILTVNDIGFSENANMKTFGDYEDIQEKNIENKTLFDELEYTR